MMTIFWKCIAGASLLGLLLLGNIAVAAPERGRDVLPVFARAHAGLPLRAVAIGGSITQAGNGWVGPWLRGQFPKSVVTMHNAGMSATGSQLGVYRLERDVISAQPDLVLMEFAVNDGHETDEDTIRYVESIVVRLKSLPHPPAIVFLEAAANGGSNRARHQRVAAHYGLLDIDLQTAVDAHLTAIGAKWDALMSDAVHPTEAGHAFYAQTIGRQLAPLAAAARALPPTASAPTRLPKPLSGKPLLLDGRLVPLDPDTGWRKEQSLPSWWNMFFNGVISADAPGTSLVLPVRGTFVGLFYALDTTYGPFYATVDGSMPQLVDCAMRRGYDYTVFGKDLPPGEHLLRLAIARPIDRPKGGPVKLGYLLVAGETHSPRTLAPQGSIDPVVLANRTFQAIPASAWEWIGPYGGAEKTVNATADLQTVFPPEAQTQPAPQDTHRWQRVTATEEKVDFAALTGWSDRGVCYARTVVKRETAGRVVLAVKVDYFGKLWVNGTLVRAIEGHGNPNMPLLIPVDLRAGDNTIFFKVHSGCRGNWCAVYLEDVK